MMNPVLFWSMWIVLFYVALCIVLVNGKSNLKAYAGKEVNK